MALRGKRIAGAVGAITLALAGALAFGIGSAGAADEAAAQQPEALVTVPGETILTFEDDAVADRVLASAESSDALDAEVVADDLAGRTVLTVTSDNVVKADALVGAAEALPGVTAQPNIVYTLMDDEVDEGVDAFAEAESLEGAGSAEALTKGETVEASEDPDVNAQEEAVEASTSDISEPVSDAIALADASGDPRTGEQYYLDPLGDGTSDSGANVREAWALAGSQPGRSKVTVALLDTGLNTAHEDLQGTFRLDLARDVTDPGAALADSSGHGTCVAGVIGATAGNGLGIAGVASGANSGAGSPVDLVPVKIFESRGSRPNSSTDTANILKGLDYVDGLVESGRAPNLRLVNLSVGYYADAGLDDTAVRTTLEHLADEHDVLCIAAGGNGRNHAARTTPMYPADYDMCLAVTSLDRRGANAAFSDYNEFKDLSAPGVDILTTGRNGELRASGYSTIDGTSFSAPMVSGVAALMLSVDPSLSSGDLVSILKDTAVDLPDPVTNDRRGETGSAGALDAGAALARVIERAGTTTFDVYRLYNPHSGEHLYTMDTVERDALAGSGWNYEDVAWTSPALGAPIYRLWNPHNGDHLYTTDVNEYDALGEAGWRQEGVKMRSADATGSPIYRLYNPWMTENDGAFSHLWTADPVENATLASAGWTQEGTAWHAL